MFLLHINLFFVGLSFSVGTCDTFLNEDDLDILDANGEPEREPTTRIVEASMSVLKTHCAVFCGPFILVECILCMAYYSSIVDKCQDFIPDPMTSTMIYILIVLGCISLAVCCYCSYYAFLFVKSTKRAMPSLRNVEQWPLERQRM